MQPTNTVNSRPGGVAYGLYLGLIALLLGIIGLGYLGFRQFATVVMPQMGAFNLLALAVIAGVASFFSPCTFLIFALTMGGLTLLVSGLVGTSQETLIQRLKASTPRIRQVSSVLLVLVGLFNIFTALNVDLFVRLLFP